MSLFVRGPYAEVHPAWNRQADDNSIQQINRQMGPNVLSVLYKTIVQLAAATRPYISISATFLPVMRYEVIGKRVELIGGKVILGRSDPNSVVLAMGRSCPSHLEIAQVYPNISALALLAWGQRKERLA